MKSHVILARMFLLVSLALSALTGLSQSTSPEPVSRPAALALGPSPASAKASAS